jgi:hypothetical protein
MANDQNTLPDEFKEAPDDLQKELLEITKEDEGDNDQLGTDKVQAAKVDEQEDPEEVEVDESLFETSKDETTEAKKVQDREKVRQATIDNAKKRVIQEDGTIDEEAYNSLPEWVKKEVESSIVIPQEDPIKEAMSSDLEALIERKIQEREDAAVFKVKLDEIVKVNNLNSDDQKLLSSEFMQLHTLGMKKSDAIEKAAKICGFNNRYEIEKAKKDGIRIGRMALPPQGGGAKPKQPVKDILEMNDDEIIAAHFN